MNVRVLSVKVKIFLTVWLVYLLFIYIKPESMSAILVDLAISVIDHGDIYMRYGVNSVDVSTYGGHYMSGHLPGGSALVIPLYFISRPLMGGLADWSRFLAVHILSIVFIASVCGALIAVLFYSFLRRLDVKENDRLLLTFLFAFGTMNFGYSTALYNGIQATLYVFTAFFLLFCSRLGETEGSAPYFWSGFLGGAAVACHLGMAPISLVLFVYGACTGGIKRVPVMLAGAFLPVALLSGYMKIAFGSFFTMPYSYRIRQNPNMMTYPRLRNLVDLFFGLKVAFFVYMPVMLLSLWGVVEAFRRKKFRAEMSVIASVFLFTGLICSSYVRKADPYCVAWPHEAHIVVRYFLPVCPFMMIPVACIIDKVKRPVLYALGGVSVFFAYLGAQAGLLPYGSWPVVYASKVFVSSFGMPTLFSEVLPRELGVEIFHTYVGRPNVHLKELLLPDNRHLFMGLIGRQLIFFAFFFLIIFCLAVVIRKLWANIPENKKT
ncbi:MAG: hypothetical protein U9R44_07710 [Candidatus Omnitrophota bacterium]|nr:hypothetical protein [Candidatus Omnitrophota bacterium]